MYRIIEAEVDLYGTKRFYVYDEMLVEKFKVEVWQPGAFDEKHQVSWPSISKCDEALASYVASVLQSAANYARRMDENAAQQNARIQDES